MSSGSRDGFWRLAVYMRIFEQKRTKLKKVGWMDMSDLFVKWKDIDVYLSLGTQNYL